MSGALDGLVALDLATYVAAPFCCTLLGELGADVIKVEQPGLGDDLRRLGHKAADGISYMWLVEGRNKKSITCNLREPEGQALIARLAARADILAENFRPGTMEKWNLGYDALSSVNPRLVMVRISAFGQTGPSRGRPGFGRIAGAVSGVSYISGYPDRPPVSPGTPTIPDYLAGVMGAFGALAAIESRHGTGRGQVVDVALYEPMLRMLDEMIPVHARPHVRAPGRGGHGPAGAPCRVLVDGRAASPARGSRCARAGLGRLLRRGGGAGPAGRGVRPVLEGQQRAGSLRGSPAPGAGKPHPRAGARRGDDLDARHRAQALPDAGSRHERRAGHAGRPQ